MAEGLAWALEITDHEPRDSGEPWGFGEVCGEVATGGSGSQEEETAGALEETLLSEKGFLLPGAEMKNTVTLSWGYNLSFEEAVQCDSVPLTYKLTILDKGITKRQLCVTLG